VMHLYALLIGFALDLILGDPQKWPHIVVGIGKVTAMSERVLRKIFPATSKGELRGGLVLAVVLPLFFCALSFGLLFLCGWIHPLIGLAVESLLCWQCLAMRSLRDQSMHVFSQLEKGDLEAARYAVGRIVGRDTDSLDAAGVTRAAVETVAENTSDGVIAPMLFMAIGGAPLGVFYKTVNTLDSMVGYKNPAYLYFGRASAILDDIVNFIPARLAGVMMTAAAFFTGNDSKNAWRIFLRDRLNHKSPNSAQTEAACAGALHVQLGGDSWYFGKIVKKPTIGDDDRAIDIKDIRRANHLLFAASFISLVLFALVKGVILWL